MRTRRTLTISLPPAMLRQIERVRKAEHRTRSELVREALRRYFSAEIRTVAPTPRELRAIQRGRAEIKRGEYVTLDGLLHDLASARGPKSRQGS